MSMMTDKLAAGQGVVGTFLHLGGAAAAECLSLSGLDYIIIDTEHGPFTDENTAEMIRAIRLHSADPFVRVRDSSRAAVLHALDLGARGIIVPNVKTVAEARSLVEYAKYFPDGERGFAFTRACGYGASPDLRDLGGYFAKANRETILMPQCETRGALESIEEIAALDGVDGIFVGPYDLSIGLGAPAQFGTSEFKDALRRIIDACRSTGKLAFIYANTMAEARQLFSQGYRGVAIGTDTGFLMKAVREMLAG